MTSNPKKIKIIKNKGIVFWVTGLSGVGKTTISKNLHKEISNHFGKTIFFNGDDFRKIFKLNKYNLNARKEYVLQYSKFCKFVSEQNINVLIAVVGLFDFVRLRNKEKIQNYVEIFIKANSNSSNALEMEVLLLNRWELTPKEEALFIGSGIYFSINFFT